MSIVNVSQERFSADVIEALEECHEYFDNRADADCDQDGFIPNKEMQILTRVKAAMEAFDALQEYLP